MARRREQQALGLLISGPLKTSQVARRMDISRQHAGTILRSLRRAEKVAIVGSVTAPGSAENVWGLLSTCRDQFAPLKAKEERDAIRDRWMYEILDKWCRFMRSYWGPMGYPTHTPGLAARARIQSFEDLEEENDRYVVAACDACIDDLPDHHRSAVYFRYGLLDVWTAGQVDEAFELAAGKLLELLDAKLCAP